MWRLHTRARAYAFRDNEPVASLNILLAKSTLFSRCDAPFIIRTMREYANLMRTDNVHLPPYHHSIIAAYSNRMYAIMEMANNKEENVGIKIVALTKECGFL